MATNYDIDYNDKRFTEVENDKSDAINESNEMYDDMISNSDSFYQSQINASKEYAETQKKNQQAATDFAIEEINQQKAQAKSDYLKEQSGAYTDWQKQSGAYGANAEQMAASGLRNTGYSESSQVSMYNQYQNRVATAREAFQRAVLNYNNAITEARLQNNAALAEIAYQALQQQLELSLAGFQYKNTLLLDKADKKLTIDQMYYQRYQDVLKQINTENTLAEQIRQYNESMAFQREQFEWQKAKTAGSGSSDGSYTFSIGSIGGSKKSTQKQSETAKIDAALTGKKTPAKRNSKEPEVDMQSLVKIGLAERSPEYIDALVRNGQLEEYIEDGKIKYRKVFNRYATGGLAPIYSGGATKSSTELLKKTGRANK